VWTVEGGDHRYHALDTGRTLELHPMFDSSEGDGARGAGAFFFSRTGEGITGSYAFWVTGPDRLRRTRWQAELRRCAGDHLTVAYRPAGAAWVEQSLILHAR